MNTHIRRPGPAAALASLAFVLALTGCTAQSVGHSASPKLASFRSAACTPGQLTAKLVDNGGAASGSIYEAIEFTNVGTTACTLQGWPKVMFVRHDTGGQIGAPAIQDHSGLTAAVTLGAGKKSIAPLRIADALNFPTKSCKPTATDAMRVYAPGQHAAFFIETPVFQACKSVKEVTLTVSAVRPAK